MGMAFRQVDSESARSKSRVNLERVQEALIRALRH